MAMTFLEIVNRAVFESKASLDPLTAANFDDPPRTVLYSHFKDWVNIAYEEIFGDRPEWFFRNERTITSIRPRLYLGGASASLAVGDILEGQSSGVRFEVVNIHTHEEAEGNLDEEITVSVDYIDSSVPSQLILRESFNRTNGVPETDVAYLLGLGYYDFSEMVPGLLSIHPDTFTVFKVPTADDGTRLNSPRYAQHVDFVGWPNTFEITPITGTAPRYIAKTSFGSFALYPQPEAEMLAEFDYTRKIQLMENWDDVPEALPEEYHMYLMWRAVEEFSDFDSNPALFRRANKHTTKYRVWLERDQLPEIKFETSRFNR